MSEREYIIAKAMSSIEKGVPAALRARGAAKDLVVKPKGRYGLARQDAWLSGKFAGRQSDPGVRGALISQGRQRSRDAKIQSMVRGMD